MRGLIFSEELRGALLAGRTERSMRAAGLRIQSPLVRSLSELATHLRAVGESVVIVRSGAWFRGPPVSISSSDARERHGADWLMPAAWHLTIPRSATGNPVIALGVQRPWAYTHSNAPTRADKFLHGCGGDFDRASWHCWSHFPEPLSVYLEPAPAHELALQLHRGVPLRDSLKWIMRERRFRAVHLAELDVHDDPKLRILQLVTSIQIGGAERIVLDLSEEFGFQGHTVVVATLGDASRRTFPRPGFFCDLSAVRNSAEARADAIVHLMTLTGADVAHGHLIRSSEACAITNRRVPVVVTLHNMPASWPAGFPVRDGKKCDLILACAKAVEDSIEGADIDVPVRTVWNGIDSRRFVLTPALRDAGRALRKKLDWGLDDFVVLSVANPRRQKRLDRLPEIVRHVADRLAPRKVRLLLVGESQPTNADAQTAVRALREQMREWLAPSEVCWSGTLDDVRPALAAANVFVSVSAYEGLSVAQLEALAAGLPVVTTAVGGAPEVARFCKGIMLLRVDACAREFAERLTHIALCENNDRQSALPPGFTRHAMSRRTLNFYGAAIVRSRRRNENTLWLVTNNFSTGGAQSSARRLLVGLRRRGVAVSAFTIQEQPHWPTHGRRALMDAGVRCVAIPPPKSLDPGESVARLVAHAAWETPKALLFWNAIVSYKVLLAETFLDTRIHDVSPGEMFFRSLDTYFLEGRTGVPCLSAEEYGNRLAGVVVKYHAEQERATRLLGAPVHVIPNGVPLRPRARGSGGKMIVFGTASRLSRDKRMEDLVDAFRIAAPKLPPFLLRIAGGAENNDRRYARELRRRARGLRVEWLGELSDLTAFYDSLDVFVMISEPAGCPNASLEAMAAELPVIATDHGGASEQVIDRRTGLLVPRFAVDEFAHALVELARDDALRAACAMHAGEHVRTHFSLDRMIESYARLCVDAVSPSPSEESISVSRGAQSASPSVNIPVS